MNHKKAILLCHKCPNEEYDAIKDVHKCNIKTCFLSYCNGCRKKTIHIKAVSKSHKSVVNMCLVCNNESHNICKVCGTDLRNKNQISDGLCDKDCVFIYEHYKEVFDRKQEEALKYPNKLFI